MRCPCCHAEKTGEYFHVLTTDIRDYKFNYCCTECLVERLRVPRHIKFEFTDKDRQEIRSIVWEEIGKLLETQKLADDNVKKRLGIARKMDDMY